ncbi:MAG: hypothetical protein WD187_01950 [Candidatus Woykebacteria bacterium]
MKYNQFSQDQDNIVSKTHTKKRRIVLAFEVLLVVLVVVGTGFSFLKFNNFSVVDLSSRIKGVLSLKKEARRGEDQISQKKKILNLIDKKILSVTNIEESRENFFIVQTKEKVKVIISTDKNLQDQARALQNVLAKAKIEGKDVSLVDFRFEKLVVRYSR